MSSLGGQPLLAAREVCGGSPLDTPLGGVGLKRKRWEPMSKLIAVIDDEPDIVELVSVQLKSAGFVAAGYVDAEDFLNSLREATPDLIILDLMLPDMDGFEVCKYLKKDEAYAPIPIIMLTARTDETDRVLGLELGADDYVTKPFSAKELVARVKAVLRRQEKGRVTKKLQVSDSIIIDLEKYEVSVDGEKVDLTPTEFKILRLLASKKGLVFTRERILDHLWGQEKTAVLDRTVDVHIKNLRDKLKKAAKFIKNVRGVGYKLVE
jgi:two-component system phosphate regulon response regulator PhoB/two-component system alkaline phosphatase synthesis response regulator PhoP